LSSWWAGKLRQFVRHLDGRVSAAERTALATWLTPAQLALFGTMHRADQRHGLDVVADLRAAGHWDPELLLAGLLHDASKGPGVGVWHRVAWALGERYGTGVHRLAARLPGFAAAMERIREHPERSAELALSAGCSQRTAELIRHQAAPIDPAAGEALRLADGRN
jgi:hypothetical protein